MNRDTLSRRGFIGAAAGTAAAGALGPFAGTGLTKGRPAHAQGPQHGHGHGRDLPHENIGMQLWTVRGLASTDNFGLEGTFEMLADAGYASVEVGGNYHGNSASEFKALADQFGLGVAGSHVPGGHNAWRNNIEQVLDEAETLGIKYAGVAIPAGDVPRTVDGFRRFNLTPVGKREIDFAKIFSALKNVKHHQYLVEEDDAPNDERKPGRGVEHLMVQPQAPRRA